MRIGYSCWGFLGAGVVDTPDGGRSHRLTWINALRAAGHTVVFLQRDRDRLEAGASFSHVGTWDAGLPAIDLLFLEWRWPIPGRNVGIDPDAAGYCPDWDRQCALVEHYVHRCGTPTVVWDKDLKLELDSPLRSIPTVRVAEAALQPRPGARRLLFPMDDAWFEASRARVADDVSAEPEHELVYVGNQYERDDVFGELVAGPARELTHAVYGKWTRVEDWPHVRFQGRVGFSAVSAIYRRSLATVLLSPQRYRVAGQFTQRIFEAQLDGCFTIAPRGMVGVEHVVPPWLVIDSGADVVPLVRRLRQVRGSSDYRGTMAECHDRLGIFRASRQLAAFMELVDGLS